MNRFYSFFVLLLFAFTSPVRAQLVTIGAGSSYNTSTSWPAPYGNYYWGSRHQILIRASELNAAGLNGPKMLTSLAFNIKAISSAPLNGLTIKMKNVPYAAFPSSSYSFEAGMKEVYTVASYTETAGWNTHGFQTNFYWDGISSIVAEICFDNPGFTSNASTYYSNPGFTSVIYCYGDNPNVCSSLASASALSRPNMRLNFIDPLPPHASFIIQDTLFRNIHYTFKNTSANTTTSYWKIYGSGFNSPLCNYRGCFYDTTSSDLRIVFTKRGTYYIKLVTPGYGGTYDSVIHRVYVDTAHSKPKANFSSSATSAYAPDAISFYDSTTNGAYGWSWFLSPYCYGCATNQAQIPNYFDPSANSQNPTLNVFDGGVFDVCLAAWNERGSDTICKKNYLKVTQGFSMCNGADSFSSQPVGYVFDPGGPVQNYQALLTGQCKAGFLINPGDCADSIILNIQQFRLRVGDTLEIRDGANKTSPLIKKLTGPSLPSSNKIQYARSGKVFMRLYTSPGNFPTGDSGFVIRWSTVTASNIYPAKTSQCPGDTVLLKLNKKASRIYTWMFNDQPVTTTSDTVIAATQAGVYKAIVSYPGCVDSSEYTLNSLDKVRSGFKVNSAKQCFFPNNFVFTDTSTYAGSYTRNWSFGDNTSSTLAVPSKRYSLAGTFRVRLLTTAANGCKDSTILYVQDLPSPGAKITVAGTTADPCDNDSVTYSTVTGAGNHYTWYYNSLPRPNDTLPNLWVKHPGSYQVRIVTSGGCDSLSVPVLAQLRKSPQTPTVTRNGFLLQSSIAPSYQWLLEDNLLTGATQRTYIPSAAGNYRVQIDTSNGCRARSESVYVSSTTGLAETAGEISGLTLFPNPASSSINVSFPQAFDWNLRDVSGRSLMSSSETKDHHLISLEKLDKGIYFLNISTAAHSFVRRIEKL